MKFWLVLILLSLSVPHPLFAQAMQQEQSVEEPEADDVDEAPAPKAVLPAPAPAPKPKKADIGEPVPTPPGVAPGTLGETGFNTDILRGLNKVTARASTIEAPIGSVVRFGTIEIVAHNCWKAAPEESPENAALLEISEIKQGEAPTRIFLGWMFSSSPGLSSLEHPFYDVTVVKCSKTKGE